MSVGRKSYDQVAQLYDRARPTYPAALYDDIVDYADLGADSRILEIGCGSGQATVPMAARGYAIDCIELGAQLAAIARKKLAQFPKARMINADFETVDLPACHYDIVFAATAFHWLDPTVRFKKAHELLKPAGTLALFWHRPVLTDASRQSVAALQEVYARFVPAMVRDYAFPPTPDLVTTDYDQLIPASGLFGNPSVRRHYVASEYSAAAYLDLLSTTSDHIALPVGKRRELFTQIEALINDEFAGVMIRETVALLYLARRK